MNTAIVELSPGMCLPHPMNRKVTESDVKELVVSIQSGGQITPILVRPHPTIAGHYEIAAGCRRTLACTLAGVPVKANVRAMNDMEIEEILIVENLQRKDLDPFDEAEKLAMLVAGGHDVAAFAAGLGKPTAWLKSRMRLTNLDKTVGKAVKGKWPLELIEALSDYPDITQKIILNCFSYYQPKTVKDIRNAGIRNGIRIDNVKFLSDERTANGKCGAGGCMTTDADMLFHEKGKCVNCMNPDCFKKRQAKHLVLMLDELITLYPDRVYIREAAYDRINNQLGKVRQGLKQLANHIDRKSAGTEVKTPDDKSFAVLDLDRNTNDSVVWFFHKKVEKVGKDDKAPASPLDASKDARPDKVAMLKGKRFMALLETVTAALGDYKFGPNIINLVAAFGTHTRNDRTTFDDAWKQYWNEKFELELADNKASKVDAKVFLAESVREQLLSRLKTHLNPSRAAEDKSLVSEVENVAKWIGFDLKDAALKIAALNPPAKSWAGEVDPITLKPKKVKDPTTK